MNKRFKHLISLMLMLTLVFMMSLSAFAASPKLSKSSLKMIKGESETIKVLNYSGKVTWSSSNKNYVTVSSKGKVTAKKAGSAYVYAKCDSKKLKCKVKVEAPKLNKTSYKMAKGTSITLKVTGFTGTVKWKSSNTGVATVSSKGVVKAKKNGSAKIIATCNKTKYECKVLVETPSINKTALALYTTDTAKLSVSGSKSSVSWSTSNKDIVSVDSTGSIKANKPGTATVYASVLNTKLSCKVTVNPNFTSQDYSVSYGTISKLVSFIFDPNVVTKAELEAEGFTVNGNVASKMATLNTATFTFNKLPKTQDELKAIDFNNMFGPMAAAIVTLTTWVDKPAYEAMYTHPIYDMFTYCQGGNAISNVDRSSMYSVMQRTLGDGNYQDHGKYAYFNGAKPENNYTPNKPLTFTLEEGPYIIPAKNGNPQRSMILISFAGDNYQRYCDTYYSTKNSCYYLWLGQWKHLVADIKDPTTEW